MLAVEQRTERERSLTSPTSSRETRREERIALDEAHRIGSMPRRTFAISSACSRARPAIASPSALPDPGSQRLSDSIPRTLERARGNVVRAAAQCVKKPTLTCSDRSAPSIAGLRGEIAVTFEVE